jgi:hypothetical protein
LIPLIFAVATNRFGVSSNTPYQVVAKTKINRNSAAKASGSGGYRLRSCDLWVCFSCYSDVDDLVVLLT